MQKLPSPCSIVDEALLTKHSCLCMLHIHTLCSARACIPCCDMCRITVWLSDMQPGASYRTLKSLPHTWALFASRVCIQSCTCQNELAQQQCRGKTLGCCVQKQFLLEALGSESGHQAQTASARCRSACHAAHLPAAHALALASYFMTTHHAVTSAQSGCRGR